MGARQSVGQTGSASTSGDQSVPAANGHTTTEEASASSSSNTNSGGARARLSAVGQSSGASSSSHRHHHRHHQHYHNHPRQTRSRSINTPAADTQSESDTTVAALIAALRQQRRRTGQILVDAAGAAGSSDQSSDSGDDGGDAVLTNSTIRSLDRILRLNSVAGTGTSDAHGSSSRVWVPPISFRCFDIKCPICKKTIPFDDVEYHLVVCMTRPKINYNEETLTEDRGECVICFEDMTPGDTIARLPCLCVYHKTCIDRWFKVKNCCPAHPGDDD